MRPVSFKPSWKDRKLRGLLFCNFITLLLCNFIILKLLLCNYYHATLLLCDFKAILLYCVILFPRIPLEGCSKVKHSQKKQDSVKKTFSLNRISSTKRNGFQYKEWPPLKGHLLNKIGMYVSTKIWIVNGINIAKYFHANKTTRFDFKNTKIKPGLTHFSKIFLSYSW